LTPSAIWCPPSIQRRRCEGQRKSRCSATQPLDFHAS
jgi:hypothetical protein